MEEEGGVEVGVGDRERWLYFCRQVYRSCVLVCPAGVRKVV